LVDEIAQDLTGRGGGRSVHVVSAMLPIWEQIFFSGVFLFFRGRLLVFWKFFFSFSESAQAQGGYVFPEIVGEFQKAP
jgi:hypothetical protein